MILRVTKGRVAATLAVLASAGFYGWAIWFLFGHFGWQVVVTLALALPIIGFPAALIWYINIGGMYLAIRSKKL